MKIRELTPGHHAQPPPSRHRGSGRAYALGFAFWLSATLAAFAFVLHGSIKLSEREFDEYAAGVHIHLRDKLHANEAVLYGFASFLGAIGEGDGARASARTYGHSVLQSYPHIHMLLVVRKVARRDLAGYTAGLRSGALPDFEVREFTGRGERARQAAGDRADYYPIVLMVPETPASAELYGLDIDSLDELKDALQRSEREGIPVSSAPFPLLDGDLAYVMFRPVIGNFRTIARRPEGMASTLSYALLVVRTADLLPPPGALAAEVRHRAERHAEAATAAPPLFDLPARPASAVERLLLPELHSEWRIDSLSQPLRLSLQRQMRLHEIQPSALALAGMASLLSLAMLIVFLRSRERQRIAAEAKRRTIEHLALHDALTGLPNRFLLFGHLERASSLAQRHDMKVGVLFLDLDGFKPVNDRLGHPVGDLVLQEVARRLQRCVRDCDTASRFGGDEFVILLSEIWKAEDARKVAEKILQALAEPIAIGDGHAPVRISTSIGIAIFPDCGTDATALIDAADHAMYCAKGGGPGHYAFAGNAANAAPAAARSTAPSTA